MILDEYKGAGLQEGEEKLPEEEASAGGTCLLANLNHC